MASAPAAYADGIDSRGGSCCADLEERVAELEATTARKGNRRVSLTISGQVTTGVMAWDDGDDSDVYVVDNTVAGGSLFRFTGSAKVSPALTAGFQLQVGVRAGARIHQVTADDDDGGQAGDTDIAVTHANWYLNHTRLGRLTVGRTNTATAGVTTIDLAGSGVIANSSIGYTGGSFITTGFGGGVANWSTMMGGNTVAASGLARSNSVLYSSPTLGGFSLQAAAGENDLWDVALRYAGEHAGFRIAGAVGYAHNVSGLGEVTEEPDEAANCNDPVADGTTEVCLPNQWKAGLSVLHVGTGLYLQGAYVRQDNDAVTEVDNLGPDVGIDRPDTELYYIQGGISKNWTGLGNTVLYGEYARVDDGATGLSGTAFSNAGLADTYFISDSSVDVWGLGVVQHIDAAAMELFLAYRQYSGDVTATNPPPSPGLPDTVSSDLNDFSVVMGGARIRF